MQGQIRNALGNIRSSLWFIPALMVVGAVVLSSALLYADAILGLEPRTIAFLFGGTASAARELLSVIAGSLITVVAVAFSITMVALAQVSNQFTPRILTKFMRDRGNQLVLGTYIGTFTYALLVMRQVRESSDGNAGFVPPLAVSMTILLALASLGALIYFLHHMVQSLQVASILRSLRHDLDSDLRALFPVRFGQASEDPPTMAALERECGSLCRGRHSVVRADQSGYLRIIDEDQLTASSRRASFVRVVPYVGQFVMQGGALAEVWADELLSEEARADARGAFVLDYERSLSQDPLFGIRQMVDIGVKALSPGINDPTTAEQSLAHLGDIVAELLEREFPSPLRRAEDGTTYLFSSPSFSHYVEACFGQIRRAARDDVHATLYLLGVLHELAGRVPNRERGEPLRAQVDEVLAMLDSRDFSESDRQVVRDRAEAVLRALPGAGGSAPSLVHASTPETAVAGGE